VGANFRLTQRIRIDRSVVNGANLLISVTGSPRNTVSRARNCPRVKLRRGRNPLKLYNSPYAPSPRRARMYAAEKGIALDLVVTVEISKNETHSPDFESREPGRRNAWFWNCRTVAALFLTESSWRSADISTYNMGPDLFGASAHERAEINLLDRSLDVQALRAHDPTFSGRPTPSGRAGSHRCPRTGRSREHKCWKNRLR
jgi:hypothetical protein